MKNLVLLFMIAVSGVARADCKPQGPLQPVPGQEFPIFDGCGKNIEFEIAVSANEGYKPGALQKAMNDLPGLFKKYIPRGDPTLKYKKAQFTPTGLQSGRLTVWGEKKWGMLWVDFSGYGAIRTQERACADSAGYSIAFVPDPKFLPKIEDAFRKAEVFLCYVETADGLVIRATATMVAGSGFKYWVSHVADGIVSPMIARLKPHILAAGRTETRRHPFFRLFRR